MKVKVEVLGHFVDIEAQYKITNNGVVFIIPTSNKLHHLILEVYTKKEEDLLNEEIAKHAAEKKYGKDYYGKVELDYIEIRSKYLRCNYTFKEGDGRRMAVGVIVPILEDKFKSNIDKDNTYYYSGFPLDRRILW